MYNGHVMLTVNDLLQSKCNCMAHSTMSNCTHFPQKFCCDDDGPYHNSEKQHVPLAEYTDNLKRMVEHLRSLGVAAVILITPPPISEAERRIDIKKVTYRHDTLVICVTFML